MNNYRKRPSLSSATAVILLYGSAASGWEIAIKAKTGKLTLPQDPISFVAEQIVSNHFIELPI